MYQRKKRGFTIIEVVISIAIFATVMGSLYLLIRLGTQIVRDDQSRLDAIAIAQSEIEKLKNMPYDDVGTVGGIPSGTVDQSQEIERNNTTFSIDTDIRYIDDPFDGLLPTDLVNTDYKQIRVEVSWKGIYVQKPVLLATHIAPEGIETDIGGGTLWIEVYNADVSPLSNATVTIINDETVPTININSATDLDGRYILPGADAATQSYHVTVSKSGYSTSQTYEVDLVNNPNPDPGALTVTEGEVTTKIFYIDALSALDLHFEDVISGDPTPGLNITLTGNKRIGTDLEGLDIPKYQEIFTTDINGNISESNLEYDTYTVTIDDETGFDFAGSAPHLPYVLSPNYSELITVHTIANAGQTLLITVENNDETPLANASVHIYDSLFTIDLTQTSNAAGQTFFTPLTVDDYTIEVILDGYDYYQAPVSIIEDELLTVSLIEI